VLISRLVYVVVGLGVLGMLGARAQPVSFSWSQQQQARSPAQHLMDEVFFRLRFEYFGYSTVNINELWQRYQPELEQVCATLLAQCPFEAARPLVARVMVELNDLHSSYARPQTGVALRAFIRGEAGDIGFGIHAETIPDARELRVLRVETGSPAAQAGIQRGERILGFNGKTLVERGIYAESDWQQAQTQKQLTLKLESNNIEREISIQSKKLGPDSPDLKIIQSDDKRIAVLTIPSFVPSPAVGREVHALVRQAESEQAKAMVIDLRDNGGGVSTECLSAVSAFVPGVKRLRESKTGRVEDGFIVKQNTGIIYSRKQDAVLPEDDQIAYEIPNPAQWNKPVVVIVNHGSASCAEYFAADVQLARQSQGVGTSFTVLGEHTLGVGNTGVRIFRLIDGSSLQLTTNKTFSINQNGQIEPYRARVVPDVLAQDERWRLLRTGEDALLARAVAMLSRP
jgi:carboxyl-terminal processing protease